MNQPFFYQPLPWRRLEEVLEKDEDMALSGGAAASAAEQRQELEALKEEKRADADELDGDDGHGE